MRPDDDGELDHVSHPITVPWQNRPLMRDKRWAISVPFDGFTLAEHGELAREAEGLGYTDAWSFEVDGVDCFSPLAVIAGATTLRVGTAIANVYTRGPAT